MYVYEANNWSYGGIIGLGSRKIIMSNDQQKLGHAVKYCMDDVLHLKNRFIAGNSFYNIPEMLGSGQQQTSMLTGLRLLASLQALA